MKDPVSNAYECPWCVLRSSAKHAARESKLDYRHLMVLCLSHSKDHNRRFSLRAFARRLGVSHTYVSLILKGMRPVTPPMIDRLVSYSSVACEHARLILK